MFHITMVRWKQCKNEDVAMKLGFKGKGQRGNIFSLFRGFEPDEPVSSRESATTTSSRLSQENVVISSNYPNNGRDGPQPSSSEETLETEMSNEVVVAVVDFVKNEPAEVFPGTDLTSAPGNSASKQLRTSPSVCSNAFLRNSYIDDICGNVAFEENCSQKHFQGSTSSMKSSEPVIRQSVECMFAHQYIESFMEEHGNDCTSEEKANATSSSNSDIMAPSALQQCLLKNRSPNVVRYQNQLSKNPERSRRETFSSMQFESCFSNFEEIPTPTPACDSNRGRLSLPSMISCEQCVCRSRFSPRLEPKMWPQRPLLLRPTPRSGTRVKGIRLSGCTDNIWNGQTQKTLWDKTLRTRWQKTSSITDHDSDECTCPMCMTIPINNGNELDGESLVTDFESDLFDGSLLVRIRGAEGTTKDPYDDTKGYFSDVHRKYQVVIQGRFKKSLRWTECLSGIKLDRPCGKLPSKWMMKSALNVIRFFAPHLDARIDGPNPYSLSPLGSMPQTVVVEDLDDVVVDISGSLSEPTEASKTLMNKASTASSAVQRARVRKKAFDKIFADKHVEFVTDPCKIYTFEFLQHLISFEDLSIDLGSLFGSVPLPEILDGQPIQICALYQGQKIWSFDVWHELLFADSMRHETE